MIGGEILGLVANLGAYDLLPESLFNGTAGINLNLQTRDNLGVGAHGEKDAARQVIWATQNDCCAGVKQPGKCLVGKSGCVVIDDQNTDILTGNFGARFGPLAPRPENKLIQVNRDVERFAGYFKDSFDHEISGIRQH